MNTNSSLIDLNKKTFTVGDAHSKDVISQSIENILLTSPGERIFQLDYGSPLNANIFKSAHNIDGEKLLDDIIDLIKKWEKRIYIKEKECSMSINIENKTLTLNIIYFLYEDQILRNFNKKIIF